MAPVAIPHRTRHACLSTHLVDVLALNLLQESGDALTIGLNANCASHGGENISPCRPVLPVVVSLRHLLLQSNAVPIEETRTGREDVGDVRGGRGVLATEGSEQVSGDDLDHFCNTG